MRRQVVQLVAALAAFPVMAAAGPRASLRRSRPASHRNGNITLRKRLHVNTLITEPGTAEVDWSSLYSISSGNFTMPSALKYTPAGQRILWGRTEYSAALDVLENTAAGGGRITQFSQAVTVAMNSVAVDGEHFDVAISPQAIVFLRDVCGVRLGATAIARYSTDYSSAGVTAAWTGATCSSATNPAGIFDLGFGYGRRLAGGGFAGKWTPHMNLVYEKSTGGERSLSLFEGVEFQMTDRLALDVSGQHFGVSGGFPEHQIVVGLTLNLGKPSFGGK